MITEELKKEVSILIPTFNEERAIAKVVEDVRSVFDRSGWTFEILVIDDNSTDNTAENAKTAGAKVLRHPDNVGYGGALRTGIQNAAYDWIATIDGDCTYPATDFLKLLPHTTDYDMVVGARRGSSYIGTFLKYPARLVFLGIAQFVVGRKIADVNSGMRLIRKSALVSILPRLSKGFSFTTTLTLSFMSSFKFVKFEPIGYLPRVGSSKVRYIRDTLRTMQLMIETIVFYNPIKAGVLLMVFPTFTGLTCLGISIARKNWVMFVLALQLFCWALLFLGVGFVLFMMAQAVNPPASKPKEN